MPHHLIRLALIVGFVVAAGCSSSSTGRPQPETHAVSGTVQRKDGQPYTDGGAIQFQSTNKLDHLATGEIKPDGSFVVSTSHDDRLLPGSLVGPHRVTIIGPMGEDQNPRIYELKTLYTVEPKENRFTVKLE